jgi:hypothetical protein
VNAATNAIQKLTNRPSCTEIATQANIDLFQVGIDCCKYSISALKKKSNDKTRMRKHREIRELILKQNLWKRLREQGLSRKTLKMNRPTTKKQKKTSSTLSTPIPMEKDPYPGYIKDFDFPPPSPEPKKYKERTNIFDIFPPPSNSPPPSKSPPPRKEKTRNILSLYK